ncbi:unnamed protein product [Leptosia nina]|uniref:Uncharacterized protein n=1 Tax=Leptosia nina TaxID=320188 RepID=A0AAV1JSI2_9NEOP
MIFLLKTRYLSLDGQQKRSGRSRREYTAAGGRNMYPRYIITFLAIACISAGAKPVRRTLNFNMFVLKPRQGEPERSLLATEGLSRFGPVLEYIVQRMQGMMSVRLPPDSGYYTDKEPIADAAENEVDHERMPGVPGVVVRPSQTKPGTYEVEIDVVVDDGKPQ